jgi:hypothetical protein
VRKKKEQARAVDPRREAKELLLQGRHQEALAAYRAASDQQPGDPWVAHSTAEIARRLGQDDLARIYLRRSAQAFMKEGGGRFALPALRNAWLLARARLPNDEVGFRELTAELAGVQRSLGFETDAATTEELSASALRATGSSAPPPRESFTRDLGAPRREGRPARLLARIKKLFCA